MRWLTGTPRAVPGPRAEESTEPDTWASAPIDPWDQALRTLGRGLFALGWMGLGLAHFLAQDLVAGRSPGWPDGWPGRSVAALLAGALFVLAGISVFLGKWVRLTTLVTAAIIGIGALARQLPVLVETGFLSPPWTDAGKAFLFMGGALAVGASFAPGREGGPGRGRSVAALDALCRGTAVAGASAFLALTGIQHFLYTSFVAGLIPGWFPGDPILWTRVTGVALVVGGLGLLLPLTRAWAAPLAGGMVLSWFFIIHVVREISGVGDGMALYEALVVAGVLFLLGVRRGKAPRWTGPRRNGLRVLALTGALALAGCGDRAPPGNGTGPGEAPAPFAPEAIPGDWEQYRVTFTPSGDTAYFAAGAGFFPVAREATIYEMVRTPRGWSDPRPAPFSGVHPDIDPFVTADGTVLLFSSIRPVDDQAREAVDLWRVRREGEGWGEPERLGVSSDHDDLFPSLDDQGRLYFARSLPDPERGNEWGIWIAEATASGRGWDEPRPLGEQVNAPGWWSFNPVVSPDGELLVFTRLNPADAPATGFGELHWSPREGTDWGPARPLGDPVNTPEDEFHPAFSPDGAILYFVRRAPGAEGARGQLLHLPLAAVEGLP